MSNLIQFPTKESNPNTAEIDAKIAELLKQYDYATVTGAMIRLLEQWDKENQLDNDSE